LVAPIHEPETEAVLAQADALVVFGSQLDGMNTKNWAIAWPKTIVLVDVEPTKTMRNVDPTAVVLNNNINGVASALVSGTAARESWVEVAAVNKTVRDRLRVGEKSARGIALVEAIEQHWPADGTIVCDMSVCGYWTGVYAVQPRSRRIVYPVGWGTLGFGLPAAIGPAANGSRTLAVCGDGGVAAGCFRNLAGEFVRAMMATQQRNGGGAVFGNGHHGRFGCFVGQQRAENADEDGGSADADDGAAFAEKGFKAGAGGFGFGADDFALQGLCHFQADSFRRGAKHEDGGAGHQLSPPL
jgi:hypothetical protein